jgi:hypothetical protein
MPIAIGSYKNNRPSHQSTVSNTQAGTCCLEAIVTYLSCFIGKILNPRLTYLFGVEGVNLVSVDAHPDFKSR